MLIKSAKHLIFEVRFVMLFQTAHDSAPENLEDFGNGNSKKIIQKIFEEEVGTYFHPKKRKKNN